MAAMRKQHAVPAPPGDPRYEAAVSVFNLSAPAEPVCATTAHDVPDVQAVIRYAAAERLRVRVHSTGHAAAGVRPIRDAVLIRTELAGQVEVDAQRRIARVPAGTRWGAVVHAAARHSLAAAHGSSPTVGVVGYLLRGGLSFYGRKVGLAVNSVRAIELVTADGELRRTDAASDSELFWALRGGGGGFGVVTAVDIDLFPVTKVITGASYWPAAHAARLMSIWQGWTRDAPAEATTSVRLMNLPAVPEVPAELAAGPVLCVDGAILSATDDMIVARRHAEELLGPLRAVADPILDSWRPATPPGLLDAHMEPTEPLAFLGDHMLLSEIGDAGTAALLGAADEGSGPPLITVGLRQLGAAFSVPDPAGGVLSHLQASYSYSAAGLPASAADAESLRARTARIRAALKLWDTGTTVPTFVEDYRQPQRHLTAEQVEAVDAVRQRVDPGGLFRDDIGPGATALA